MIPNEGRECWQYLAAKNLLALLRGITYHSDFNYLNFLHSFATKGKLESQKKVCKMKDFCKIILLTQKKIIH